MMPFNIIVAAFDDNQSQAETIRQRLLNTLTETAPERVTIASADAMSAADLRTVDAVVLFVGRGTELPRTLQVLAMLDEAGVAALVLLEQSPDAGGNYEFAGALTELADREDAVLWAKLQGMLHRQREVNELRKEVSLAQRFQGGLKGEIARMHEELQLAAMVQREFLPRKLPHLYGIRFAVLWRPVHYVSGDIYDISRLDDDHVGVFIADAVGHGVPAALMTMVICRSLTTKIISGHSYRIIEPSEVLARLNRDLVERQSRTTRFATAAYSVINCRSRTVRFAGAGHPPPILFGADGTTRLLETSGGLLGVFEDETYDQTELELAVGDRLLLHSDGFEQAFPAPKCSDAYERRLPTTRYRKEFDRLAHEPTPEAVIEAVSQRIDGQTGSLHQVDDLTLVCIQAGPITHDEAAEPNAAEKIPKDLAEAMRHIDKEGRTGAREWMRGEPEGRTNLAKTVQEQVTTELNFLRKFAVEEGAVKTTKAIDLLLETDSSDSKEFSKEWKNKDKETENRVEPHAHATEPETMTRDAPREKEERENVRTDAPETANQEETPEPRNNIGHK